MGTKWTVGLMVGTFVVGWVLGVSMERLKISTRSSPTATDPKVIIVNMPAADTSGERREVKLRTISHPRRLPNGNLELPESGYWAVTVGGVQYRAAEVD